MGSGSLCDLTLPVKPRCPSPIGLQRLPALLQAPTPDTRPGFPSQLHLTAKPNCKVVSLPRPVWAHAVPHSCPSYPVMGQTSPCQLPPVSAMLQRTDITQCEHSSEVLGGWCHQRDSEVEVSYPPISSLLSMLSHSVTSHSLWPHGL